MDEAWMKAELRRLYADVAEAQARAERFKAQAETLAATVVRLELALRAVQPGGTSTLQPPWVVT